MTICNPIFRKSKKLYCFTLHILCKWMASVISKYKCITSEAAKSKKKKLKKKSTTCNENNAHIVIFPQSFLFCLIVYDFGLIIFILKFINGLFSCINFPKGISISFDGATLNLYSFHWHKLGEMSSSLWWRWKRIPVEEDRNIQEDLMEKQKMF